MSRIRSILVPGMVLLCGSTAMAQDNARDAQTISWFEQFLWSDRLIGLSIIWLLLAMSAASIGFMIHLSMLYRRKQLLPESVRSQLELMIQNKRFRDAIDLSNKDDSYLSRIVSVALGDAGGGYAAMERSLSESADAETSRMMRPLEYLNIVGNIAPMLGLFGTVYGMIDAFQALVSSGGQADPASLAAGISTALVTTFWGLIVAMPALAAYAVLRNRVDALTSEGLLQAERIIAPFKPARQSGAKPAPAAKAAQAAAPESPTGAAAPAAGS